MPTRARQYPLRPSLLLMVVASVAAAPMVRAQVLAGEQDRPVTIADLPVFRHQGVVLDYKDLINQKIALAVADADGRQSHQEPQP